MTLNHILTPLTQEQREENQKKREDTRKRLLEESKNLIQDFTDLPHWRVLASKHNIKLPAHFYPSTDVRVMRKYLKKLGIEKEKMKEYLYSCGVASLQELCNLNPTYPCYAEIGFALEWIEESNASSTRLEESK